MIINAYVEFLQTDKVAQRNSRWSYWDINSLADLPSVGDFLGYAEGDAQGNLSEPCYQGIIVERHINYIRDALDSDVCEVTIVLDTTNKPAM
ncbi:hypothetical protein LG290_06385 [Halomonas sediminis]